MPKRAPAILSLPEILKAVTEEMNIEKSPKKTE
jgi:hypothetical protein